MTIEKHYHQITFHKYSLDIDETDTSKQIFMASQLIATRQLAYLKYIADMYFKAFNLAIINIQIQKEIEREE